MRLQIQVEQLYRVLNAELDNFSRGERFYSVRELGDRFNTNRRVIDATLERMESEALIRRRPNIGIFCNVDRKPQSRKILFAAPDWPGEVIANWSRMMNLHVERDKHYQLSKTFYSPENSTLSRLPLDGVDALIAMRGGRDFSREEVHFLTGMAMPVVFVYTVLDDLGISTVNKDNVHGGMLAADCLMKYGHRKLLVVASESNCGDVRARINAFESYARLHGASVNIVHCHSGNGESSSQCAYQGVYQYIARNGCDFTGMFIVSDGSAPGALTALRENGIEVPGDISVIGFDGLDCGAFYHPPLTSVGCDVAAMIEMMFVELDKVFRHEQECFHIMYPMHIVERNSVNYNHSHNTIMKGKVK